MSDQKVSFDGSIVKYDDEFWFVEKATDQEMIWRAIIEARVSGSIGATETVEEYGKEPERYASVRRIIKLNFQLQGAYGARVEPFGWHHEVLKS
jgi:hypothetical protein